MILVASHLFVSGFRPHFPSGMPTWRLLPFFQFQALECLPKFFLFNFSDALSTTEQGQIVSASSSSLRSQNYLDNVIQWNVVVKRYRDLKSESPGKDNDD